MAVNNLPKIKDFFGYEIKPGDIIVIGDYMNLWGPHVFKGYGQYGTSMQFYRIAEPIVDRLREGGSYATSYINTTRSERILRVPDTLLDSEQLVWYNQIIDLINVEKLKKKYEKRTAQETSDTIQNPLVQREGPGYGITIPVNYDSIPPGEQSVTFTN